MRPTSWEFTFLLVALGCMTCSMPPEPEHLGIADETVTLRLEPYVGRLVTLSPVLNQDTLRVLFDTGGGETLLEPSLAEKVGCTPTGRSVGFRMSGERVEWPMCGSVELQFLGALVRDTQFGVWDIMALLPEGLPHLDGIVSLETFRNRLVTVDLSGGILVLETEASFRKRVSHMSPVQARLATGIDGSQLDLFVRGKLSGVGEDLWFLVDTGNLSDVALGTPAASGFESAEVAITLGDSLTVRTTASSSDIIYDGALSEDFLRQIVLSVDLKTGETWVARSGSASQGQP